MNESDVLSLNPDDVSDILIAKEIIHMAKVLNAFWSYNYLAAENGIPGKHALLKSGLHSDGFFISRIFLKNLNVRKIIANQLVLHFNRLGIAKPDRVVGIPKGATELRKEVASIMDVNLAEMQKVDGQIILTSSMEKESLLLIEDFCTRGTGFTEAVLDINERNPEVNILPYELVVINRGGLTEINVPDVGKFKIVAAANHRINDWKEEDCYLCNKYRSIPIKPKETDKNWKNITTSQS